MKAGDVLREKPRNRISLHELDCSFCRDPRSYYLLRGCCSYDEDAAFDREPTLGVVLTDMIIVGQQPHRTSLRLVLMGGRVGIVWGTDDHIENFVQ